MEVYLHIPFCRSKCAYCALHSFAGRERLIAPYVAALQQEIRCVGAGQRVDTVYFGGGTPSLLAPAQVGALLETCAAAFSLADGAEITMEAHPATVDAAYLRDVRAAGVNRLSFGVESGHDDTLRRMGRTHTVAQAQQAVAWARAAGFDNVGVDLIYGLPGDTRARWRSTLARALAWSPDHVSAYALAVEPGTPLARRVAAGQERVGDGDLMAALYALAGAALAEAGLQQYELSNWARPGKACRHNVSVWRGGGVLWPGRGRARVRGGGPLCGGRRPGNVPGPDARRAAGRARPLARRGRGAPPQRARDDGRGDVPRPAPHGGGCRRAGSRRALAAGCGRCSAQSWRNSSRSACWSSTATRCA
ncbi:MAG: radical SAM family heme chaperone HemW [Anaerolineae bacterium]|nr:radical SAM family heme chaperone HemW [Anaerolineae bacterium]